MLETEPTFLLKRTSLGDGGAPIPERPIAPPTVGEDTASRRPAHPRAKGTSNAFTNTGQRLGPEFHAAGFLRRFAGGFVDLLILLPIALSLGWLVSLVTGITLPPARHHGVDFWLDLILGLDPALCGFAVLLAVAFLAYALVFQTMMSRTPGMRLVGARVIDIYGDPPTVGRSLLRSVSYFASLATFGLGFLWIAFDAERRGLHDWLSSTYVVKTKT